MIQTVPSLFLVLIILLAKDTVVALMQSFLYRELEEYIV